LQRSTGIKPVLIESSRAVGGLSRTVCYKGNRMDIGGHRFFSKSDRVMRWWLDIMPLEAGSGEIDTLRYQGRQRELPSTVSSADPRTEDLVMLVRPRKSRIYFMRRFFDYPILLTSDTLKKMGLARTLRCGFSYLRSSLLPQRKESSLEDFLINRFGEQLYMMFYKSYTEKVWGVPCHEISAEWGAQRIKGLSLKGMMTNYLKKTFGPRRCDNITQKHTKTSLIEKFLYPKFGPGQLWEHVAELVVKAGGELHLGVVIDRVHLEGNKVVSVGGLNEAGERIGFPGDYFFSTMPVRDLIHAVSGELPKGVADVARGLPYRDFILVGLLVKKLAVTEEDGSPLADCRFSTTGVPGW
jgi:protoporphyrinogen oxidase